MSYSLRKLLCHFLRIAKVYKRSDFNGCGEGVIIHENVMISDPKNVSIGNNVYIGPNARIYSDGGCIIEDNVILGPDVIIMTSNHNYNSEDCMAVPYDNRNIIKKVFIGKNCWIGERCVILPGAKLNQGVVVGAASIVNKEFEKLTVVAGSPAKIVKRRNKDRYFSIESESYIATYRNNHPYRIG